MNKLILMRHAKSDWSNSNLRDMDRPLSSRGERDAPRMGQLLAAKGEWPELIVASPSLRTRMTVDGLLSGSGLQCEVRYLDNFYPGGPFAFQSAFQEFSDCCGIILLLAHNPGIEEFIMELTGEYKKMPTAAIAVFDLPSGNLEKAQLVSLYTPKDV